MIGLENRENTKAIGSIGLFAVQWVLWGFIQSRFAGQWLMDMAMEGLIWALPMLALRFTADGSKPLFERPFPWLPCLCLLCGSAAFLHTVRIFRGLLNTQPVFSWTMIAVSVQAGILEELTFRGGFFDIQRKAWGFWPAAVLNGVLFVLYHQSGDLAGMTPRWLFSFRTVLIFGMGVLFCGIYQKWRNLALNMVVHTAWDILSFLLCVAV